MATVQVDQSSLILNLKALQLDLLLARCDKRKKVKKKGPFVAHDFRRFKVALNHCTLYSVTSVILNH